MYFAQDSNIVKSSICAKFKDKGVRSTTPVNLFHIKHMSNSLPNICSAIGYGSSINASFFVICDALN